MNHEVPYPFQKYVVACVNYPVMVDHERNRAGIIQAYEWREWIHTSESETAFNGRPIVFKSQRFALPMRYVPLFHESGSTLLTY